MRELIFTQPALLWGLLAATLPLIIHLINRHRARRRPFAAIDFLLRVQRRSARRILLKQLLLLTIRSLLIAYLVLAAAGPVLRPTEAATAGGPTATALVIDTSFSMRARADEADRFEAARERARAFVRGMAPGDTCCLIAAGQQVQTKVAPCSSSPAVLLDAIDALRSEWGDSDLTAAMETAAGLLVKAPHANRQILLLTDAAAHAFGGSPAWPAAVAVPRVVLHDLGQDRSRDNHAVLQVVQSSAGPYLELSTRLILYGSKGIDDLPVEVDLASKTVARGFADLMPGKTERKLFTVRSPSVDHCLGTIRLPADHLPADDELLFWVTGRQTVEALLINGDMRPVLHNDELFYLEHALAPSGSGASGIRLTTVTPERFRPARLQAAQVVFLANVRELGPSNAEALGDFVAAGGGLFISVGDKVDVDSANQVLAGLLPWKLRDVVALGPADPDGAHRRGMAFGELDAEHPALAIFSPVRGRALTGVRTRKAVVLEPGQAVKRSRVLIRYANGSPALVEGRHRAGRVLLFTSSLDRDWTNWPARASFLPFLQRATAYLAGRLDAQPPPEVTVGASISIPLLSEADGLRITKPDDEEVALRTGDGANGRVTFRDTRLPGWYQVVQTASGRALAGQTIPGFFVRLPLRESDLTPISPERLQQMLGADTRLRVTGDGEEATRSQMGLLLLLALCLVLCEALLTRR